MLRFHEELLSHWHTRFDRFSFSTHEFYERLTKEIEDRQLPDVSVREKTLSEGGLFSDRRVYLRIHRGDLTFMLCAAPFGVDFFVSWWLLESPGCVTGCLTLLLPFLTLLRRTTFYREDTATIFQEAVHQAVLSTIEGIFTAKDRVFEGERKPTTRSRLLRT